jgi:hypothetical protein
MPASTMSSDDIVLQRPVDGAHTILGINDVILRPGANQQRICNGISLAFPTSFCEFGIVAYGGLRLIGLGPGA